jgi:hypothetical protein
MLANQAKDKSYFLADIDAGEGIVLFASNNSARRQ